jgi:hypothetical protein
LRYSFYSFRYSLEFRIKRYHWYQFKLYTEGAQREHASGRTLLATIDYFLGRNREEVIRKRKATQDIEAQIAALEAELRGSMASPPPLQLRREVQERATD